MSFPTTGSTGLIDLSNPEVRLHFINRALHILQLHCNEHGLLVISSSEKLLARMLPQLTDAQVRETNQTLCDLGLRDTKPGGGEHYIRMDVTHVTLNQLKSGRRIPYGKHGELNEQVITHVILALQALRESAEPISHPRLTLGVVRNHMQIIEDLCGDYAGDVIMLLKSLALYRMQAFGDSFVCFVDMTTPSVLAERDIERGQPLIRWPDTLAELLPPSMQVGEMSAEKIIESLALACETAEDRILVLSKELAQRTEQLDQLAELFEQQEAARIRAEEENTQLSKENERLMAETAKLKNQLAELRAKPAVTELKPELKSRVDGILGRYKGKGSGAGETPEKP